MTDEHSAHASRSNRRPRSWGKGRMEAFSDGVFAIAITLLVLDLAIPEGSGKDLLTAFFSQWPQYLAYVVSFATIGAIWLAHTAITDHLDHADSTFLRLNLLVLLLVSFIPFPTRFLSEYISSDQAERVAVTIYGVSMFLVSAMIVLLWRYARSAKLVAATSEDGELAVYSERLTPGLAAYAIIIVLGLFAPVAAVVGYLVIAIFIIVPLPLRRLRRGRGSEAP
jgi:uncharacterized membrane protein